MTRNNKPWQAVQPADISWSDSGEPVATGFDDVYYSRENGLEEGRYVFLNGNNLPARWLNHPRNHFCIAETGFGTGLNFLLTWQAWLAQPESRADLHYLSVEKYPLSKSDLRRALTLWPELQSLAGQLLDVYPSLIPGQHRVLLNDGRVRLDLWWEDAEDAFQDLAAQQQPLVDAWYLDGFAPARNEAMWSYALLKSLAAASQADASFSTFTAAGDVRRNLVKAGFHVEKVPGYGRKRECLRGSMENPALSRTGPQTTPWDIPARRSRPPDSALVIGAGLAGCHVAASLARRGVEVTLLEQGRMASAGSGNEQGILYTRLSRSHSPLVDFALQSFRFAANFYQGMFQDGALRAGIDGELCGNFQQSDNSAEMKWLSDALRGMEDFAQVLDAQRASAALNLVQPKNGYWFPLSGWLNPAAVCQALTQDRRITVIENCGQLSLHPGEGTWRACSGEAVIATADCVIAATGTDTTAQEQFKWLPLQSIRGQTTHIPTGAPFDTLRGALCHTGYIAPPRNERHCVGATFDVGDNDTSVRRSDHLTNLQRLATAVPAWQDSLTSLDIDSLQGRVGFRCASPDYLPAVGAAPDYPRFLQEYAALRKDARKFIGQRGPYIPGLYLSTAHGSRGLTSSPIAAELLASMLCNEPPPLCRELGRALSPARFIVRDLCRNRI